MNKAVVDLSNEKTLRLERAILFYSENGLSSRAFATVHGVKVTEGVPTLEPGELLSLLALRELHKSLYRPGRVQLLPENVIASTAELLAWVEPPRQRVMFYRSDDPFLTTLSGQMFPQPPLLFIAKERRLSVFALASSTRPTAKTPVFNAPYYNTSSWGVCLGSTHLPETLEPQDTEAYSAAFFASAFTHGTD